MSKVSLGQAHEMALTLERAGATPEFYDRIAKNVELAKQVVALAMSLVFRFVSTFDRDMRKEGCKLVSDSEAKEGEFEPELAEFLKDEEFVNGEEMLARAQKMGNCAGQRHAEAMLRDSSKIPEEWRKYVLVFTDTVWQASGGHRRVACLRWGGGRWCLRFYWLRYGFGRRYRLVRLRKSLCFSVFSAEFFCKKKAFLLKIHLLQFYLS